MKRKRRFYFLSEELRRTLNDERPESASNHGSTRGSKEVRAEERTLEAQAFVLKDGKGDVRARLDCNDQGPYLAFLDPSGKPRAALVIAQDDPHLCFYDGEGKIRMHLSLSGEWPMLALHGQRSSSPTSLELSQSGAYLSVGHPHSREHLMLSVGKKGTSVDLFHSLAAQRRSVRLVLTRTGPTLTIHATTGGPRNEFSVRNRKPIVAFLDKKGRRLLSLTIANGRPVMRLQGGKGKPTRIIRLDELGT